VTSVTCHISISLDGERDADSEVVAEVAQDVGAYTMGRKMFGGGALGAT